jgi:hypothetical protein
MQENITQLLDKLYIEAEALKGISLKEEPLRFDVAAPIITEWEELDREVLTSRVDKRNPNKFLQSVISIADIQIPVERIETKQILEAGISFVSVLFARNIKGNPTIMVRAYVPSDEKYLDFERITTVLTKTYCPKEGISWEQLCSDIKSLDIKDEFHLIVSEFKNAIHEVKDREELEKKVHKTIVRYF